MKDILLYKYSLRLFPIIVKYNIYWYTNIVNLTYSLSWFPFRCISDHGRECRYPFLDEDVVSFLNALPVWIKVCLHFRVYLFVYYNFYYHIGKLRVWPVLYGAFQSRRI